MTILTIIKQFPYHFAVFKFRFLNYSVFSQTELLNDMASLHTRGQQLMAKIYCDVLLLFPTSDKDNSLYYKASVTTGLLTQF